MIDIDQANQTVVDRMMDSRPTVVGTGKAIDVIPGFHRNLFVHAGPPITWERMWVHSGRWGR